MERIAEHYLTHQAVLESAVENHQGAKEREALAFFSHFEKQLAELDKCSFAALLNDLERRVMLWDNRLNFEFGANQNTLGSYGYSRFPVLAKYSWIFGMRSVPDPKIPNQRKVFLTGHPVIVLWNPYNVEMRIPSKGLMINAGFYKSLIVDSKVYVNGKQQQDWTRVDPGKKRGITPFSKSSPLS